MINKSGYIDIDENKEGSIEEPILKIKYTI